MTSQYPVSRTISCSPARQLESEAPATTLQHQNIRLSSSLEDINQTGRVSDVKAIFSPEKDADKQYFGDCDDRPSSLRGPPIDHTRANTNTKQSSRTESTRPDAAVGTDQTWFMKSVPSPKSPTSLSVEDSSSSRERKLVHHGNPRRRPQGYLKVRSKSLGRTPSTTIAKMTDFFKEEAEQGASHRVASVISVDEVNEEYMQEHLKQPYYAEKVSTNSRDGRRERFEPQVKTSFTNQNSKKGNLASKHEGGRPANLLQADAVHRDDGEQPEVSANIGQFINMYNDIDSTSRYADPQRQLYAEKMVEAKRDKVVMSPTRQSVVDRSRTRMPAKSSPDRYAPSDRSYDYHMSRNRSPVERASHQSRLSLDDNMVSQVQELENEIDDRPLAASAFKAWLRTDNEGSSALEQNIETAYQRQTGQAEKGWNSTKVRHRSQPDKTKSVPWWKQQNQMSANQSVKRKEAPVHEEVTRRQAATTESTFQQFRVVEDRIDNRSIMKPPHQSPSRQSPPRSFLGRHSPPRQFSSNLSQPRQILPRQYPPEVNPPPQSPSPEIPSRIPQVPQDLISPYANYQLEYGNEQTDKADTSRPNDRPEDHYAQIRKVRPNDPQQVYVREASQQTEHQQQLHVNIVSGPPKPQRFYDDSRQTADQETMVDNQTYYDPYTNATETTQTEQHHQTSNNAYQQYADQQHDKRYGSADLLDSSHPNNPTNFQQQSATLPMTNNPSNWRYETEARHQIPVDYEVHQANPNTRPDSNLRYQSNVPQYDHREYPHSPTSSYPSNGQGRQLPSSYPDESYGQQPSNNYPAEAYRQPPTSNYSSEGYRQPPSSYPGEGHRQPSGINPGEGHRQPPNSHPGEGYRQPPRSYPGKSYSQQPVSTYQPQRQASYPDNRPHISTNQPADMTRISRPVSQRDHWRSATVDRHLGMRDPRHMTSNIRMTSSSDGIDRLDYNQRSNSLRHNAPQRYQNPRQIGHHGYQRQPDVQRIQKQDIPQRNAKSSRQRANQENDSGKQRGPKHSSGGKGRQQNRADGRSSQKSTASQEKNARQSGKSKGKPLKQNNDSAKAPRIEEPKRTPPSSFALPDFIPIQHVNPSLNNQQPEMMYSPQIRTDRPAESNSYNPYMNRARPGVSVMFNPLIGTTDF